MRHVFIADLAQLEPDEPVTLTGFVKRARKYSDYVAVEIADISALRWFKVPIGRDNTEPIAKPRIGERVRLDGSTTKDPAGEFKVTSSVTVSANPGVGELFDTDRNERAGRMLLSRAINKSVEYLNRDGFVEFDSRVIVAGAAETGLEPLQLTYPGFGASIVLATSPSAQIIDFMNVTGVNRAFTNSLSFSTSYRFPNGSVESRVVMGKLVDRHGQELRDWVSEFCRAILRSLDPQRFAEASWTNGATGDLLTTSIAPVKNSRRSHIGSVIREVFRIENQASSIVAECYDEFIDERLVFGGFVFYPSHVLELLDLSPNRQVRYPRRATTWAG